MFCSSCGKEIKDSAQFCNNCGAPVKAAPAAANMVRSAPASGGALFPNAEQLVYRVKCPSCGNVYDARLSGPCPKCGEMHTIDFVNNGFLQLYRMGHFSGAMMGEAIYLNGEGMGHVANTSTALIELPPGVYNVHCAISTLRHCEDVSVQIEPGKVVYVKSQLKMGAIKSKLLLHIVDPSEMPPL